ncbi:MAG: spondin domain-containing protein [Saprospiraceae bacterium]|nr:spondin domain-containing protein [Saprospiraceae bacterium]
MKRTIFYFFSMAVLIFTACEKEGYLRPENYLNADIASENAKQLPFSKKTFKITITSLPNNHGLSTPFAPGVWLTENRFNAPLFKPGKSDYGQGLEALAEDGDPGQLANSLSHLSRINDFGVFHTPDGALAPAPIMPGQHYSFTIEISPREQFHFATMFVQSNDLFAAPGPKGISLFDQHGDPIHGDITHYLELWDAGTEVNEEPGMGMYQAPRQSGPDMGPDENGVVQVVHDGFVYPALNDILQVTVEPQ